MYDLNVIAGVKLLAKFLILPQARNGSECIHLTTAIATKSSGIVVLRSLVPHGMAILERGLPINTKYKQASIQTLERWLSEGLLEAQDYNPKRLRYRPEHQGYANFWDLEDCVDITEVDLLNEHCLKCDAYDLIEGVPPAYLEQKDRDEFARRAKNWKQVNQDYLKRKASEFTRFWVSVVGLLGSNGDEVSDLIHAIASKSQRSVEALESQKLANAIYNYATACFEEGWIPYLSTDYSPDHRLRELLADNGLNHLGSRFPWKTDFHLKFDDLDRSALFEAPAL